MCSNDDPRLSFIYLKSMSNLLPIPSAFKCKIVEAKVIIPNRYDLPNKLLTTNKSQRSRLNLVTFQLGLSYCIPINILKQFYSEIIGQI